MLWQSEQRREKVRESQEEFINELRKPEGLLPKSWEGAEKVAAHVDYDINHHASFSILELYNENVGEIFQATVKFLGSHRVVFFRFYVDSLSKEDFLDLRDQFIDSFRYDKGYGFGESKGMVSAFEKAFARKVILPFILAFVGISIFVMILQHWARG